MGYGDRPLNRISLSGDAWIGETPIFKGLDLAIELGEWTCLLGASGVGKSTVLRLFAGLADHVCFDGEMSGAGNVALMAQDDLLLPWLSAVDNVLIGARLRAERPDRNLAQDLLARVGLADHATKKPKDLSGGQRQRVALARTLMEDRQLVLLDEPFSALDALTRSRMQELTTEVLKDRTVLLVTHDPGEAVRLGHNIMIMEPTGLQAVTVPHGNTPRPVDAENVLRAQADLLQRLRK